MQTNYTRSLAKCKNFDFYIHDRGWGLSGEFEYEDGSCQGLGYIVDTAFILNFMGVFGVELLQDVNNKSCWVTHSSCEIIKIEPLHKKDGKLFDIKEWGRWIEIYNRNYSIGNIQDLTHPKKDKNEN